MLIAVQSNGRLNMVALPKKIGGAHWLCDAEGVKLAFVEGRNGSWLLEAAEGLKIRGASEQIAGAVPLSATRLTVVNLLGADGDAWCLAFYPDDPAALRTTVLGFAGDESINVGRSAENDITYEDSFVSSRHLNLTYRGGAWTVTDLHSSNGVHVNGVRLGSGDTQSLAFGDIVSILGFHITVGAGFISLNNPGGKVKVANRFVEYKAPRIDGRRSGKAVERPFFYPALRFPRSVEKAEFSIDAPPTPEKEEETSLAMKLGPSLIMGLCAILSACVFISMMADQGSSMLRAIPMVAMAISMLAGSVIWPLINSRHERKKRALNESKRRGLYSQYISKVTNDIAAAEEHQRSILVENRVSVSECLNRAAGMDSRLMDRISLHDDFLDVRIGVGDVPFSANIRFPEQHFTLDDDDLLEAAERQLLEPRVLKDVPVAFPLYARNTVGVIGEESITSAFVRGLIVQIAALHSYGDVKLVVLCDSLQKNEWLFASHLPHCFSDDKAMRYFACGLEEANALGMFLERVIEARKSQNGFDARNASPYYVVVCLSEDLADKSPAVRAIADLQENIGISLIAAAKEMKDLPKGCSSVIGLSATNGYLLNRDSASGARVNFAVDGLVDVEAAEKFSRCMGAVKLDLEIEGEQMPNSLGFLEMFGAGNVEHLNISSRWTESNASASLACRVGVDAQGEPFLLNLHEKIHGPHGLIAGTTGSGKSEFIITYILSMALTYSPDEVAFVLIDYKGGGLAKAFDNEHVRLPHLAGVITNLDGAAIKRSLASIQSELKRRQALFNEARDMVGGDNIDIYDYLDLFRQRRMTEPCPHLFIVADEFAELKQQEPEFMDELISAARVGRSLGVHLILATQKPSGVVNDQIWSNARFKVCLKVADESDSKEMIKRPDAASIKQAGRFYLLVGYNEFYALGQSGYSGAKYIERERFAAAEDNAVVLISNAANPLVSVKPDLASASGAKRPELVVVLDAIQKVAGEEGRSAHQLWLQPIPELITVNGVVEKYHVLGQQAGEFSLNPVVGEFDDPAHQRQGQLTIPLSDAGGVVVYGAADSGAETVLYAMMYSLIAQHSARDLHAYVLDFGSESLRAFESAPQVGNVIGVADEEKMSRFFAFMEGEYERRRKAMAVYGGSFSRYRQAGGTMPALVVVINDISALLEAYPNLEDALLRLSREAGRSGIYLVVTAAGTSSVRVRMRQNFRFALACNLVDASEYSLIFGSMHGVVIPHGFARGLVGLEDGIFEFQGARLTESGDDYGYAQKVSYSLAQTAAEQGISPAPGVPMAPERVSPGELAKLPVPAGLLAYGIYDDLLVPAGFDFTEAAMARCVSQRKKDAASFAGALIASLKASSAWRTAVVDAGHMLAADALKGCDFATQDDDQARDYLGQVAQDGCLDGRMLVVMITGISDFLNRVGYDSANAIKATLKGLNPEGKVRVLLLDAASDASYTYEDWFKMHLSNRDGLWIGPGIDAQNVISIGYSKNLLPDSRMSAGKGYESLGGTVRLVHVVSQEAKQKGESIE